MTIDQQVALDECLDRLYRLYDGTEEAKAAIRAVSAWHANAGSPRETPHTRLARQKAQWLCRGGAAVCRPGDPCTPSCAWVDR